MPDTAEHLSDPEYWRGLYVDAIELGKEILEEGRSAIDGLALANAHIKDLVAELNDLRPLVAENERLRTERD